MYLKELVKTNKTVFSLNDLQQIWKISDRNYLKLVANRLSRQGKIERIRRGFYVLNSNYNIFELSNKLKAPSYVSLETVLRKAGIIFQDYSHSVYAVSNNTLQKEVNGIKFNYFKIADNILFNLIGIERNNNIVIASPERALADRVYLTPNYYFDNLDNIDIEKLKKISLIYNKRTQKEIKNIIESIQKNV